MPEASRDRWNTNLTREWGYKANGWAHYPQHFIPPWIQPLPPPTFLVKRLLQRHRHMTWKSIASRRETTYINTPIAICVGTVPLQAGVQTTPKGKQCTKWISYSPTQIPPLIYMALSRDVRLG